MRRHSPCLVAVVALVCGIATADEVTRIAVMEIPISSPQSGAFAKKLAAEMRVALGKVPNVEVMSERDLKEAGKRLGFDPAYADADTAAAALGKQLGVDFIIMGTAVRLGKTYKVTARFLQVATAQSATTKGDVEDTKKSLGGFAKRVVDDYRGFTRSQADRHYQIALQYLQAGDYVNALRGFRQASAIDRSYAPALVGQVTCYYSLDSLTQAEALADSAIALDPSLGQSFYYKAMILQKRGRCEDALPFFERALAADSSYTPVYFNWAQCLRSLGRADEATALLQRALSYTDDLAYVASLGRLYEDLGMTGEALKVYVSVLERDSTYSFAWRRVIATGSDHLVTGNFGPSGKDSFGFTRTQVIGLVRKGIAVVLAETGPSGAPVYEYLGKALTDIGDYKQALSVYQEWERLDPTSIEPIARQVPLLTALGQQTKAIRRLEEVVDRNPDNVNGIAFLALAYADEASAQKDPTTRDRLLAKAKARAEEALRKGPNEPLALMVAGEIKERESERKEEQAKAHVKDKSIPFEQRYDEAEAMFDEAIQLVKEAKAYFVKARPLFNAQGSSERAQYVEKKARLMDSEVERLEAVKTAVIYAGE